ncbi:Energy-coupling factor transporter transmembrane protein EcfT [Candidatus Desulfosporosinus infrequens]|uniref:Energy-coupling factor transporter transmembrane protein EcfT n=1 Tax=Candidatus Desulfosporosinus infrequens TaxID=2043169 RepID=A0A2U3L146_9FIRM|nr:Energy-coupling factor transporter transmembrane protein EcfT [Candidatus Desulfosporosinus infrequens]
MRKLKLGGYIPGTSLIHQLDPRTKLLGGLAVIIAILVNDSWPVLLLNTLLIFAVIYLAKINMKSVLQGVKWLLILSILTLVFQCLFTKGDPLFNLGPVVVSKQGIYRGGTFFLRLLILYLSSSALTMTTSPMKMAGGLEALFAPLRYLGVPVNQFAMLLSISLRFVPTLIEEAETITRAQKSRGAPFTSPKKIVRLKTSLSVLIPLIVGSLQRATDLATAMESRCYTGGPNYSRVKNLHFGRKDQLALGIIVVICILPLVYFPGRI